MSKYIMFADNDLDFLATRSEFLERAEYFVFQAKTLAEAEWLLQNANIHLAVLDIRMENDDDELDKSGIELAKNKQYRVIPKIILTNFAYYDSIREVLIAESSGFRPALDVIKKEDGPEALIKAIKIAFDISVHINWNLIINWKLIETYSAVRYFEPNLDGERLIRRAEEFEDLFRRLFYNKDHIRIEHMLWQRGKRAALVAFAYKEGIKPESFVVICGDSNIVCNEAEFFTEFAPKTTVAGSTILGNDMRAETIHFSANAYSLIANDLEAIQSLLDLYRVGPEKTFNAAMDNLYRETLKNWHQDKLIKNNEDAKNILYSERLYLADFDLQQIEDLAGGIVSLIPVLEARMTRTTDSLSIHFRNQSFDHPNPIPVLAKMLAIEEQGMFTTVPGFLSGENILTDSTGRTWLTDFADAGLAPVLWNYTSMEAMIRYDWVDTKDLQRRYELEQCLVQTDFFKPEIRDLEPSVRKPARAIQVIRKLAARTVGKDTLSYHQGIFFHAASRLMEFDPSKPVTNAELARFGHILMSMAMLADLLKESKPDSNERAFEQGEQIQMFDEAARILLVGSRKAQLAPQPFALFKYLYEKSNQLCTKGELLEEVFQNKYDEGYLHTLIGRIRKIIEVDPEHPRFLFTIQSAGYKLTPKPE